MGADGVEYVTARACSAQTLRLDRTKPLIVKKVDLDYFGDEE